MLQNIKKIEIENRTRIFTYIEDRITYFKPEAWLSEHKNIDIITQKI